MKDDYSKGTGVHYSRFEKKTARKTEMNVLWHSTVFPSGLSVFLVSSDCLLVRVTMVDENKAVVCCLLVTSAIMLSEKKKSVKCGVRKFHETLLAVCTQYRTTHLQLPCALR